MTPLEEILAIPERAPRRKRVRVGSAKDAIAGKHEFEIQAEIVRAIRKLGFRATASLNGVKLPGDPIARARKIQHLKSQGMEAGQYDLCLRRPKSRGGPAYAELEIKRPGEPLSVAQEQRGKELEADGFAHGAACDVDSAVAELKRWGWL